MAYLEAKNGPSAGTQYELGQADTQTLGRSPDCHIVADGGAVSRVHARLKRIGQSYFVEDMRSRNGTFVNDQPVSGEHRLQAGDVIRVCDISFTFHASHQAKTPESSNTAILFDETEESSPSTIMSKVDLSSENGSVHSSASADVKLKALIEITKSLGKSVALDQVLPQVLKSLFRIFIQADRGFIVLKNEKGELETMWAEVRHQSQQTCRISRTILDEVIRSKQAVLSADAAEDSRFEMSQSIADFRIRSMICAPLVNSEHEVIGAMQIDTDNQRNRFREEDLEVLASIATQAGIAIDNAQMHERALLQREYERDLELAREVQKSFLPDRRPVVPGFKFFDFYQPANHIGGDYFDYIHLPDGRLAIIVADVVGHGAAAALLMSKLSAAARFSLVSEPYPSSALTHLNRSLAPATFDGRFITLVMVILDPTTSQITVLNAGHMPPLIRRSDGSLTEIGAEQAGLPLMIDADYKYQQHVDEIGPGDTFVLFTDGVTEAMNKADELYGIERLRDCIAISQPEKIGQQIVADVDEFIEAGPAKDDMCLVCCARDKS
ncbi:MAG: SpoIIE family protein phosphatase [Planctomycetaceae bacterium]|nr:SpoIIE family protein phosphatase [Planctomycetaceae bacterium]